MGERLRCPHCGGLQDRWDQPRLTVDALVFDDAGRVLLVERRGDPPGWAIPGGFVDAGETMEQAVARELAEETGLTATRLEQFHTYSEPGRDPRHPTVTLVFLAEATGIPRAADDAADARFFPPDSLPSRVAFDHREVVADAVRYRETGVRPGVLD